MKVMDFCLLKCQLITDGYLGGPGPGLIYNLLIKASYQLLFSFMLLLFFLLVICMLTDAKGVS